MEQEKWNKIKEELKGEKLPCHLAIIMDGNGRWAKKRGLPRRAGHKAGVDQLKEVTRYCIELGIPYLTLYAFSTENWGRPREEVNFLMQLFQETLNREKRELVKNNICVKFLGDRDQLPRQLQRLIADIEKATNDCSHIRLNIALNYGARREILKAVEGIYKSKKQLPAGGLKETDLQEHLYTHDLPDVDLLIRPGGEIRVSNFLLWQIAYAELYFTEEFWPDFGADQLYFGLKEFCRRQRRYGKV